MKSEGVKDGGPAFPVPSYQDNWGTTHLTATGLSLRDYFAAKAMQGMWASDEPGWECSGSPEAITQRADMAYKMADAMLRARESSDE